VDAAQALADLTEISSQIEVAVLTGDDGAIVGSTLEDAGRAERVAAGAARLLEQAASVTTGRDDVPLAQVEAATPHGSVFVVREGGRTIAATTGPEPTVGLVFYDLKSCLRSLDDAPEPQPAAKTKAKPKPRARPRPRKETDGAA
jgi:predicted regulator of Ras-like GTPase activity (Roadblock/LC7/MglB family)